MALAVCKSYVLPALLGLEGGGVRCGERAFCASPAVMSPETWLPQQEDVAKDEEVVEKSESQFDIWSSIQSSQKAAELQTPYVHPLMRRSSSLSQKSLEICTENLGSETGSDGFSSEDLEDYFSSKVSDEADQVSETGEGTEEQGNEQVAAEGDGYARRQRQGRKELSAVNYYCSTSRWSPPRVFPPPLPSISRRDGPCLHMRQHRRDGRLVVEAVPVPSQNYLHAQRQGGRLLLTFINTSFEEIYPETEDPFMEQQLQQPQDSDLEEAEAGVDDRGLTTVNVATDDDYGDEDNLIGEDVDEMGEEEGEEEVEVVDRGIVVEVKVSRQPQLQSGGGKKVHRSSLVINKFVGGTPLSNTEKAEKMKDEETPRWVVPNSSSSSSICSITTTTTAAVAVAAASSSSSAEPYWGTGKSPQQGQQNTSNPDKLHFTSKKLMNRQALLYQVRRCSESHRPLFFWEPCCIATT